MRFFDWLFRKHDSEFVAEMPMTLLNRWFLYDTGIGNENELAGAIGLTKVSDEVDAKEREDSDIRVEQISYLIPFLDHISNLTAETIAETQRIAMVEDQLPPDQVEQDLEIVKRVYKGIALSSLLSSFAIANALDFIHLHPDVFIEQDEGVLDEQ